MSASLPFVPGLTMNDSPLTLVQKHFKQKNLIILRACNELLRRLSRAEDTVFCGRVFIFLFQSFPLGDRSSVNLRGEYHVENVTTFENVQPEEENHQNDHMDVDSKSSIRETPGNTTASVPLPATVTQNGTSDHPVAGSRSVKLDQSEEKFEEAMPDMDTLYSIFWSLQHYFSQPTKLFEEESLRAFKSGLQSTMRKFQNVHQDQQARGSTKLPLESKRALKRKRDGQQDELSSSFNPKYLTSRDLFELEISDLAFRRHILVQVLILVDFLLSLTPKAKKKLEQTSNKSVLYAYTLNDENAKWANNVRNDIATYLQQGPEGKFYYRMVDTVLSRDKNWVHWKAEGCPPIAREPISAGDFAEAEKGAQKACTNKKIRPTAMGTLDLKFLSEDYNIDGMEKLKSPSRYTVPTIHSFKGPIATDECDIEMAKNDEEKQQAIDARASKLWRTLRIASKSKLNVFDKIDDGHNLKPLFESEGVGLEDKTERNGTDVDTGEQAVKVDTQGREDHTSRDKNGSNFAQDSAVN